MPENKKETKKVETLGSSGQFIAKESVSAPLPTEARPSTPQPTKKSNTS